MNKLINGTIKFMVNKLGMNDKEIHALANLILFLILSVIRNTEIAIWSCFWLSVGKEVGDYFNKESSGYAGDLIADFIGIIIGYLVMMAFTFVFGA